MTGAYVLCVAVGVALALSDVRGASPRARPVPDVVRYGRALELCTQRASASMKPLGAEIRFEEGTWLVDASAWSALDAPARAAAAEWASTCLFRLKPVTILDARTGRVLAD